MDDAIKRFDTLNKLPKVLQALGVSAEDSERATRKLADGIDGLPTKLDEIASTAQRMYTSFDDMDKASDRSEERRVGKECRYTRWPRDWSSDVCSSDLR